MFTATVANANISRLPNSTSSPVTLFTDSRQLVKFDTAFDTINQVYLIVWGTQAASPVEGQFVSATGTKLGGSFAISSGSQQSGWARVVYSVEQQRFLVTYTKITGTSSFQRAAQFVTYSNGPHLLGSEIIIDSFSGPSAGGSTGAAYSSSAGVFFGDLVEICRFASTVLRRGRQSEWRRRHVVSAHESE